MVKSERLRTHMRLLSASAIGAMAVAIPPSMTWAASFACEGTLSQVEQAVCSDTELSAQDETIASLYKAMRLQDLSGSVRAEQRQWLEERNSCASLACLREVYGTRLTQLSAATSVQMSFSGPDAAAPEAIAQVAETAQSATHDASGSVTPEPSANTGIRQPVEASPAQRDTQPPATTSSPIGFLIFLAVVFVAWLLVTVGRRHRRLQAFATAYALIDQHAKALALQRRQLIVTDPYGTLVVKGWRKEAAYFYETIIWPRLDQRQRQIVGSVDAFKLIEERLAVLGIDLKDIAPTFNGNDPTHYEHHCADILREAGWSARVTKGSGDQGSDVIAERDGIKLVLQCKLYSYPVGNKAVQEVAAARAHELANHAACVTNSSYTPSAKSLAVTNRVALLHHDQLRDWADELVAAT